MTALCTPCSDRSAANLFDRPLRAVGARSREIPFDGSNHVRMRGGDIVPLTLIVVEVVQLERRVFREPNRFPRSHAHCLLKPALVELPVEVVVRRLRLAAQGA